MLPMLKLISNLFAKSPILNQEDDSIKVSEIQNFDNKVVALQGDLAVVTIENLMQLMSHAGLSGELRLVTIDNDACFIIRHGALVFGHLKFNFPRTGERLVQAGHITNENLRDCLRLYREQSSKLRLGEILVDKRFVSTNHLEEVIKEQVKDCFFKVLTWQDGSFSFYPNESPPKENILLDERIDHLIIEGIVALDHNS